MSYTVAALAQALGLPYQGDGGQPVNNVSGWDDANESSLVFIQELPTDGHRFSNTSVGCVIAQDSSVSFHGNLIISRSPKLDFARAAKLLHPRDTGQGARHTTSSVSPEAILGRNVEIGPYVSIGANVRIGQGSILHAGVTIGVRSVLGEECILHPGVVLYPGVELADRVVLHAGVVVGSDGFGYVRDDGTQLKFPQVGRVRIQSDVEIGPNTTIDRGSLGTTEIGEGSKIDNLVQIGHNVKIGRHVVIAAQTGVAGSTMIDDDAVIGGQVGFGDHARVEKGAIIGSKAGVLPGKIVRSGNVYWGVPVRPLGEFKRLNALFGRLPTMKKELDPLRAAVTKLAAKLRELQEKKE